MRSVVTLSLSLNGCGRCILPIPERTNPITLPVRTECVCSCCGRLMTPQWSNLKRPCVGLNELSTVFHCWECDGNDDREVTQYFTDDGVVHRETNAQFFFG